MLPGPNYIIECPKCSALLSKESLTSGNTFDAKLYSDGKRIAPMLPEFPSFTKCNTCSSYFWIEDAKEIGEVNWRMNKNPEWKNAQPVRFLSIPELFESLNTDLIRNKEDETFIRQNIWWSFNDRVREDTKLLLNVEEESTYRGNIVRLIELLDFDDINNQIMIAELHRNLGDFGKCEELINTIHDENLSWVVEKFKEACEKRNSALFQLN